MAFQSNFESIARFERATMTFAFQLNVFYVIVSSGGDYECFRIEIYKIFVQQNTMMMI